MLKPQAENALAALRQDLLNSLQESDLEGVIDTLMKLYAPAAIADIVQAKIGVIRLHDFVRPTTETGTWRVQEIKEDASGIRIKAARHPGYDHIVSGPPDLFIALEERPTDKPEHSRDCNDEGGWDELRQELDQAPKIHAYLKQLSQDFMTTDLPAMALADALCSLVGDV